MSRPNAITVEQAVAALTDAARSDFPSVEARLKAAGFDVRAYIPIQKTQSVDMSVTSEIGALIEGRGIYHGAWSPRANGLIVHAYSCTDLLRDRAGQLMLLTWYEARDELARRNGGRCYGNGGEAALGDALTKSSGTEGAYQDGDLVMGPQVLLKGVDRNGDRVRTENTYDLLGVCKDEAFKNISQTLKDARPDDARWSWSCSGDRGLSSVMWAVSLSDGFVVWGTKDVFRIGVLPFRFFRESHAVKVVSHLGI